MPALTVVGVAADLAVQVHVEKGIVQDHITTEFGGYRVKSQFHILSLFFNLGKLEG